MKVQRRRPSARPGPTRMTVWVLALAVLGADIPVAQALYDCRLTGKKNLPSCCCAETGACQTAIETPPGPTSCCAEKSQTPAPPAAPCLQRDAETVPDGCGCCDVNLVEAPQMAGQPSRATNDEQPPSGVKALGDATGLLTLDGPVEQHVRYPSKLIPPHSFDLYLLHGALRR